MKAILEVAWPGKVRFAAPKRHWAGAEANKKTVPSAKDGLHKANGSLDDLQTRSRFGKV